MDPFKKHGWEYCRNCGGVQPRHAMKEGAEKDIILNLTSTFYICADERICALMKAMKAEAAQRDLDIAVTQHEAVEARVAEGEKKLEAKARRRRR